MKQKIIGTYQLVHRNVQLVAREGDGGEFYFMPDDSSIPRIKVGMECDWEDCLGTLIHETTEFAMAHMGLRYGKCRAQIAQDSAGWQFFMDHTDFGEVCAHAASFLVHAIPALFKAHQKWR